MCADKITQGQNNSSSKITQAIFKITQGIFAQKLKLPEVFCLIQVQKVNKRGVNYSFLYWRSTRMAKIDMILRHFYANLVIFHWKYKSEIPALQNNSRFSQITQGFEITQANSQKITQATGGFYHSQPPDLRTKKAWSIYFLKYIVKGASSVFVFLWTPLQI